LHGQRRSIRAAIAVAGGVAALAWAAPQALGGTTSNGVELVSIGSFDSPTYVDDAPGFPNLLFVTERSGVIEALDDEAPAAKPFLDISDRVSTAGEGGLLSIAFPPDYAQSRRFYVYYVNNDSPNGSIEVDEFKRKASSPMRARPGSRREVITIPHPDNNNHYGGTIRFGPGGRLFLATGDGGGFDDLYDNASRLNRPLGKLLRIDPLPKDPNQPGHRVPKSNPYVGAPGLDEIWAYGLRNPFRFTFDAQLGSIAIGDVGQNSREEVDITTVAQARGANFGWPAFEGDVIGPHPERIGPDPATPPAFAYDNPANASAAVTGGLIVRDPTLPASIQGRYLFADFYAGQLVDFVPDLANNTADDPQTVAIPAVSGPVAFCEGVNGQVYVVSLYDGGVYRLEASA
jgi:glucose/arabinose dehydrogenase